MFSEKELENLILESDKIEIPQMVESNIDHAYRFIRRKSEKKRLVKTAVKSTLLSILIINIVCLVVLFNISSVSAKSYTLESGQLFEESNLLNRFPKISLFNKSHNLDLQISKVAYENDSVYVQYVLVGNVKNFTSIDEFERQIKVIGADITGIEANNFNKISDKVVVFSETIKLGNPDKDAKALIIKQNIDKIEGINGNWDVSIKIMKQKVKEEKIKNEKVKVRN